MYYSKTKPDKFIGCLIHNIVVHNLLKLLRIMKLNGKLLTTSLHVLMSMLNSSLGRCFSFFIFYFIFLKSHFHCHFVWFCTAVVPVALVKGYVLDIISTILEMFNSTSIFSRCINS